MKVPDPTITQEELIQSLQVQINGNTARLNRVVAEIDALSAKGDTAAVTSKIAQRNALRKTLKDLDARLANARGVGDVVAQAQGNLNQMLLLNQKADELGRIVAVTESIEPQEIISKYKDLAAENAKLSFDLTQSLHEDAYDDDLTSMSPAEEAAELIAASLPEQGAQRAQATQRPAAASVAKERVKHE